jgi:hypothetical protein
VPGIAVLRDADAAPEELLVARVQRVAEGVSLGAGVVDVILALDVVAGGGERLREGIADGRAASVADVQGARRVGGDEFDLRLLARADGEVRVAFARVDHPFDLALQERVREAEVDEARRGDFGHFDGGIGREVANEHFRDRERRLHRRAREPQGQRTGVIAVRGVLRALDGGARERHVGQFARCHRGADGAGDERFEMLADIACVGHGTYRVPHRALC